MQNHVDKPAYMPQLDAFRGLACLMVLLAHANATPLLALVPDKWGPLGVGLFFALSGFLITRILLHERSVHRNLMPFYLRRVARIFPVYYLTLAVLWLIVPDETIVWAADFTFNLKYMENARDYFRPTESMSVVAHYWSLCVEEHFYWIWPVLLIALPGRMAIVVPALIVLLTPWITVLYASWLQDRYVSSAAIEGLISRATFTQLTAIAIGSLAALFERDLLSYRGMRCIVTGVALILAAVLVSEVLPVAGSYWMHIGCGGTLLLCLPLHFHAIMRPLQALGRISFSAYVYHLPIYILFGLTRSDATSVNALLALALTLAAAAVSTRFFEQPITKWARSNSTSSIGIVLTALIAGFAACDALSYHRGGQLITTDRVAMTNGTSAVSTSLNKANLARIQQIYVGSSHCECTFVPSAFGPASYNLGNGSQDLYYDCQIARKYADELPNLRRVIFEVSVFTPWYRLIDAEEERWRLPLYQEYFGISPQDARPGALNKLFGSDVDTRHIARRFLEKSNLDASDPWSGFIGTDQTLIIPDDLPAMMPDHAWAHRFYLANPNPAENLKMFVETIQELQQRGIETVLVTAPAHRMYWSRIRPEVLDDWAKFVTDVRDQTGVRYFNYLTSDLFGEKHFRDIDHLNTEGAELLSRTLALEL